MQKRILRGTRNYHIEEKGMLELKYYIIEQAISQDERYYGIEIKDQETHNRLLLSESKEWVEEIINQFIGNGVTPDTMEYIIDDIMGIPC